AATRFEHLIISHCIHPKRRFLAIGFFDIDRRDCRPVGTKHCGVSISRRLALKSNGGEGASLARKSSMDAKTSLKSRLPSRHATEGPERAPHRAFYYEMGLTTEQIQQPFVGVATCWNEAAPCNIALMRQAQAVKQGVAAGGATPREF